MNIGRLGHIILLFVFCVLPNALAVGQEYVIHKQHFSIEDGLSNRYVNSAFQDSKGFIWVSTQFKVNQFDGYEFKHYDDLNNGLSSNTVYRMVEDANGKLWLFFFYKRANLVHRQENVIEILDPVKGKSQSIDQYFDLPFEMEEVQDYTIDSEKNIWLLLKDGRLYEYSKSAEQTDGNAFQLRFVINDGVVRGFTVSKNQEVGVLADSTFLVYDLEGSVVLRKEIDAGIGNVTCDYFGNFWLEIVSNNQLGQVHPILWKYEQGQGLRPFSLKENGQTFEMPQSPYYRSSFYHDRVGRIWACIGLSLVVFDKAGSLVFKDSEPFDHSTYLHIEDIFFDTENNAWLSHKLGLTSFKFKPVKFKNYRTTEELHDTRGIFVDDKGTIYVNERGLKKIDPISKEVHAITERTALGLIEDNSGKLWAGAYSSPIISYDPKNAQVEVYGRPNNDQVIPYVYGIRTFFEHEGSNQIWLGTTGNGIAMVNQITKQLDPYDNYNDFDELKASMVSHFHENEEGIWVLSSKGIFLVDANKGVQKKYSEKYFDAAMHLHEDSAGIFWIATIGYGLLRWDRTTNEVQQFTTANGLSHNITYAVYEDDFGFLWIPGNNGLMRFNKQTGVVTNYLPKDGLPDKEFNYSSHYQTKDGQLYFGGLGGITSLHPKDFVETENNNLPNAIQILEYKKLDVASGVEIDQTENFLAAPKVRLLPKDRSFYLKFMLPYFNEDDAIKYVYKIEGLQNQWSFIDENFIRIHGLPYGSYSLLLKAQNSVGQETAEVLTIPIEVERPIYLKAWFIALVSLIFIGLILGFIKWRSHQFKLENKRLEGEVQKRTATIETQKTELENANAIKDRLMAIIGHDLRGPLFNLQNLEEQINYLLETGQQNRLKDLGAGMEKSTRLLTETLNNLLNWSMNQMGEFPYHPELVKLEDVTQQIVTLFEGNAKAKDIKIVQHLTSSAVAYVDKNALGTIMRNLLSNAIKFTPKGGEVSITSSTQNGIVTLAVSDSGTGMSEEQAQQIMDGTNFIRKKGTAGEKSTGLGLVLCRDLVIRNKGVLKVRSEEGEGTVFELELPVEG